MGLTVENFAVTMRPGSQKTERIEAQQEGWGHTRNGRTSARLEIGIESMKHANHLSPELTESTRQHSRKPYHKPEFRHERVFETMALSCGKLNATQQQCKLNKKQS